MLLGALPIGVEQHVLNDESEGASFSSSAVRVQITSPAFIMSADECTFQANSTIR